MSKDVVTAVHLAIQKLAIPERKLNSEAQAAPQLGSGTASLHLPSILPYSPSTYSAAQMGGGDWGLRIRRGGERVLVVKIREVDPLHLAHDHWKHQHHLHHPSFQNITSVKDRHQLAAHFAPLHCCLVHLALQLGKFLIVNTSTSSPTYLQHEHLLVLHLFLHPHNKRCTLLSLALHFWDCSN